MMIEENSEKKNLSEEEKEKLFGEISELVKQKVETKMKLIEIERKLEEKEEMYPGLNILTEEMEVDTIKDLHKNNNNH